MDPTFVSQARENLHKRFLWGLLIPPYLLANQSRAHKSNPRTNLNKIYDITTYEDDFINKCLCTLYTDLGQLIRTC